jgi:alpha-glucoside transport system permease protein
MYQQDPNIGAVNALGRVAVDAVSSPGALPSALPSRGTPMTGSPQTGLVLHAPLKPGGVAKLGLTGIAPEAVPGGSKQAVLPASKPGDIVGVVWKDFKPGGGTAGKVEQGEAGLPGVHVALKSSGKTVQTATSGADGSFDFKNVPAGTYNAAIDKSTFNKPWAGYSWLGPSLITASLLIAYIWIWAGFAMVVIGAGLAAMPRDVLEAARTDGASEWQTFRRVTVPLLAPVLSVVFITMIINVLKVFDIVLALAPESTQQNANVIALAMWRTAFGGVNDFGTGSAIAVFLFLLVIPVLALNIRRFKREQ